MSRLAPIGAALLAGLAAWLTQGTIGFEGPGGARLALLPASPQAFLIAAAAAAAILGFWRLGASLVPVALLGFVVLPWLPIPAPPAFLIWTGRAAVIVWVVVGLLLVRSALRHVHVTLLAPRITAGVAAFLIFGVSAWRAAPMVPGGDEPHYLIITQSLLKDRSLTIEDVHRRGDYRAYYAGDLQPHVQRRGKDGRIYSVHAPGLPAMVAPAFLIGGYPAVVIFLLILASAGSALAWHVGWLATRREDAAWFGWAATTVPITAIFQSFTIYPDGPGGVLALTGLWALLRARDEKTNGDTRAWPWLLHGAALALLPWFHSRFAVLAGGLGALILLRLSTTKKPAEKAVAFLAVPAVSAILWVGFFVAIYGTPDPSAPYGPGEMGSFRFVPGGLAGLLFDQRFGLLAYAPVLAAALVGLGLMVARRDERRLGLELLFVLVPYLLTVTHFAMWWGGWSAPARFFAAVLPMCAVPAACAWSHIERRGTAVFASGLLVATAIASTLVVWVDRGRLAYNTRETTALWLDWLGRAADLTAAAPLWSRDTDVPLFRALAIWVACAAASWVALRWADARAPFRYPTSLRTACAALLGLAVMIASTIVWSVEGSSGRSTVPSQLDLVMAAAEAPRAIGLQLDGVARVPARDLPSRVRVELSRLPTTRPVGRETPPMFALPSLPAGEYRVTVSGAGLRGLLMLGIARDQFTVRTLPLPAAPVDLRFPVAVRGLLVGGDEDARRGVRGLRLEPVRIFGPGERAADAVARRAVAYDAATVFFLDEATYPEPEAFWVGGARSSSIVVQPTRPSTTITLRLRNGASANRVILEAARWRHGQSMSPGEEADVDLPIDPARGAARVLITSEGGFRPSEVDSSSRDGRYLGVWIKPLP